MKRDDVGLLLEGLPNQGYNTFISIHIYAFGRILFIPCLQLEWLILESLVHGDGCAAQDKAVSTARSS